MKHFQSLTDDLKCRSSSSEELAESRTSSLIMIMKCLSIAIEDVQIQTNLQTPPQNILTFNMAGKKKKRNNPLTVPPHANVPSRKRARQVTTRFHQLLQSEDASSSSVSEQIQQLRPLYQKASQVNTSFFSTSKWVLKHLHKEGWLFGIGNQETRVLEVGAINTQLLDAGVCRMESQRPHRLQVRAIDLESTDPRIEVADFLQIPIKKYHVIVCSMVINCIPTPSQRGLCLARLSLMATHAVCLTLPRTCLELSPHMTHDHWNNLLRTVGFEVKETNLTPKIALYWLKPTTGTFAGKELNALPNLNQGRKYRHVFGVTLGKDAMTLLRSDRSKVDEP